jgi:hypothetical protein
MAAVPNNSAPLLTIVELSRHSRLSIATIHRLKNDGRIRYFQPAGKGGRLLFPADAIEQSGSAVGEAAGAELSPAVDEAAGAGPSPAAGDQRLSGPRPAWMR